MLLVDRGLFGVHKVRQADALYPSLGGQDSRPYNKIEQTHAEYILNFVTKLIPLLAHNC
jgi:hypothetical protein